MPIPELDGKLAREYDRVRSHARIWQLRAAMAREHTGDLMDENRQWQRDARTLLERARLLRLQWALIRSRVGRDLPSRISAATSGQRFHPAAAPGSHELLGKEIA